MKKLISLALAALLVLGLFTAAFAAEVKKMDTLTFEFVPSKESDVIIQGTKNLPELVKAEMLKQGYDIGEVKISVGTDYNATGEAMDAGAIDVGWLPGGTYALYSDGVDVILTATRNGLSNDSTDPRDWNGEANKTLKNGPQVTFYRSLIYATPSAYGKVLAAKVNAGEKLTWEDVDKASWGVMRTSSSAGYIYPTLWLMEHFDGKKLSDLSNVATLAGYPEGFALAAAETIDIIVCYADGRNDYELAWNIATTDKDATGKGGMGRTASIWEELNVIGVTDGIYNDTVAITKAKPEIYNSEFIKALQDALIAVISTDEGKAIFDVYSHTGYAVATDADYEGARKALEVVK